MQSSIERKRLLKMIKEGPANAWMALVKCASGLALIVLITVIGNSGHADRSASAAATTAVAISAVGHTEKMAHEHRKHVFDARRQRFQGGAERKSVAGQAVQQSNQLPVTLR